MVAGTEPDKVVNIKLIRDGKPNTVEVKINEMTGEIRALTKTFENRLKGVSVQDLTPSIRKTLDVPKRITGVIVTEMADDSPAEGILMRDDIIMEINKKRIRDLKDYDSVAPTIKSEEDILVLIYRKNSALYLTLAVK
jgi:S1-C subfamily serine protease